jgi:long-subunit fatty acid transport protein
MKIKSLVFALAITTYNVMAQSADEAMRYSQSNLFGTARYTSMAGAFGALGGDLSSINSNPAGSSVFNNNQFGLTLNSMKNCNESEYFGSIANDKDSSFDLNQAGAVWVFEGFDSDWKKFGFALNYENTKNFDNSFYTTGINPSNSVSNYFLGYANGFGNSPGIPLEIIRDLNFEDLNYREQQAHLGYYSYIIEPQSNNNNNSIYTSNILSGGDYTQTSSIVESGNNGKFTMNFSGQYTEKWHFGFNFNAHFSTFRQNSTFIETNENTRAGGNYIERVEINNSLTTTSGGVSFQFGTIYKPTESVRLGLTYDTPTWLRLEDRLIQSVNSNNGGGFINGETFVNANPNFEIIFPEYDIRTPGKWTGSFAYIFDKKGLISIDYALKDYTSAKLSPNSDYAFDNQEIKDTFRKNASEVRIGGEYKIERLSLRGGYRFVQSPYKDGLTISNSTTYTGGFGYNFGSTKIDLSYSATKRDNQQRFFSEIYNEKANVKSTIGNVYLTLLFEM